MHVLLHGGYGGYWDGVDQDDNLYSKLLAAAKFDNNQLLIGLLGYKTENDFGVRDQMLSGLMKLNSDVNIIFAAQDTFLDVVGNHRVLFLQGSKTKQQADFLSNIDFDVITKDKLFIGDSSAGATLLCHSGYSASHGGAIMGKNLLDLSVIPHANAWDLNVAMLALREKSSYPIICVNEKETVEFFV